MIKEHGIDDIADVDYNNNNVNNNELIDDDPIVIGEIELISID